MTQRCTCPDDEHGATIRCPIHGARAERQTTNPIEPATDEEVEYARRHRGNVVPPERLLARIDAEKARAEKAEAALSGVVDLLHDRAASIVESKGNPEVFRALVKAARAIRRATPPTSEEEG